MLESRRVDAETDRGYALSVTSYRQHPIVNRVESFILLHEMCEKGDRVLLTCSGGPDSTAMLDIMRELTRELGIEIGVLSIDHGQHAGSDNALRSVQKRCKRWRIPFIGHTLRGGDLPEGASEAQMRHVRYQIFSDVAHREGYRRVATGHTRNDQVETILMRILRGTSTSGLSGIPAKRLDFFIRPLLECTRQELVTYLRSRRLRWTEDPTNTDIDYYRNRIRHDILPLLREKTNPSVDQAILRLGRSARRDGDLLGKMAAAIEPGLSTDGTSSLPLPLLLNLHDAVLSRVIVRMLVAMSEPGANLEQSHIENIVTILRENSTKKTWALDLPGKVVCGCQGNRFFLKRDPPEECRVFNRMVDGPGEIAVSDGRVRIAFSIDHTWDPAEAGPDHVFFDGDLMDFPLQVRSAASGDRMQAWGDSHTRKVSNLLLDAKIPRHMRPTVPIVVKDGTVLWVAGLRRSDAAPVGKGCRRILSMRITGSLRLSSGI